MTIIETAHRKAIAVIEHCDKPFGFSASGLPDGYEALWARDSMITTLGASILGAQFQAAARRSLETLSSNQSPRGQIPNAVGDYNVERKSKVTFNSIDSSLWYVIGHHAYAQAYRDTSLLRKNRKNIERALLWLEYQDPNEDGLLVQQPTMDWMDALPHKYGRTINTQALWYAALRLAGKNGRALRLQRVVNGKIEKYLSLYDSKRGYYLPWIWKNHDGDREEGRWFDTFGNLLAIVTGLATPAIARSIFRHIEKQKINRPYPCKALFPPFAPNDKGWHSYFSKLGKNSKPYCYLNGGVWPFIGGFYVAALVKAKQFAKAKRELALLALANEKSHGIASRPPSPISHSWGFHEWLHGATGAARGTPYQGWSAGMYVFAYGCLKKERVLLFDYH